MVDRTYLKDCMLDDEKLSSLIETRITTDQGCIYCGSTHVVKNGIRKDGTQRFLCRDCKKSFLPTTKSVISRTRKNPSVWASYLNCMMNKKTLRETSEECGICIATAFSWRHKILDALQKTDLEALQKTDLEALYETDKESGAGQEK